MKKKSFIMVLALVLVFAVAVGGVVAWLTDKTNPVKNTFTVGDINIKLEETTTAYKMVPGNAIAKDPKVTVEANSEACWLFVKVEESENFGTFMTYAMADGWTQGKGTDGIPTNVYWCKVDATTADTHFAVLKDNQVTVKDTVTKTQLEAVKTANQPTLTFTAYAVQQDNMRDAATAWAATK